MRLLFTNAGRRTYMVEFALDVNDGSESLEVFVSDCQADVPAFHVSDKVKTKLLPPVLEDKTRYIDQLETYVKTNKIDLIIPLSDLDLDILAKNKSRFNEFGSTVMVSDLKTVNRFMNKKLNYEFCQSNNLPTTPSYFSRSTFDDHFPAIQKPIFGSGSAGIVKINSADDLATFEQDRDMLQHWIDGEEYGVDILNDLSGNFVRACVKKKLLMRAGETDRSKTLNHPGIEKLSQKISSIFHHVGNLDVDIIETADGHLIPIDFNPRFGGGYPATHVSGLNYLQAIIDLVRGTEVKLPSQPQYLKVMKGISLYSMECPQ
jgi:carbamoyl-phosphate synthase large subunit